MADVFTEQKRSEIMSRVKGRGNESTERRLIKIFRAYDITGWRRNQPVFGKPDFVFPTIRLAVFVDGCFWHACPLHGQLPKSNRTFWEAKLWRNRERDRNVNKTLKQRGWLTLRIWQHELKNSKRVATRLKRKLAAAEKASELS